MEDCGYLPVANNSVNFIKVYFNNNVDRRVQKPSHD